MIQLSASILQGHDWKNELAQAIRDPAELLRQLELPESLLAGARRASQLFPLRVPRSYLNRIKKGDPSDPLLRQILPLDLETEHISGYSDDPVGDLAAQKVPGLLHKYHGRALLITSPACAIHCRYCFRRNFPYSEARPSSNQWQEALHYLATHQEIHEIILSGGDPLSLTDQHLARLISRLEQISHLKTLRIHTRLPVAIPQRVSPSFVSLLSGTSLNSVMVIHVNHANEIDNNMIQAMSHLRHAGVTLLNQSVLLRQVNDSVDALTTLSHKLFENGILPYYLHQLDRVSGAAHFAVEKQRALDLLENLRQKLPGYLLPRLVEEQTGNPGKLPLL